MPPQRPAPARAVAAVLDRATQWRGGSAWGLWAGEFTARAAGWLAREEEQRRLFPWAAVAFGIGVLLYFAADREPQAWAPMAALAVSVVLAILLRRRRLSFMAAVAAAFTFAGFLAGALRTETVTAPTLRRITIAPLTGFVESVEARPQGPRAVLRVVSLGTLGESERPRRVRVSMRAGTQVQAGDFIRATARLLPPPAAARPGGYDFARDAFFDGIGAVGSLTGRVELAAPPEPPDRRLRLAAWLDAARNALTERIARSAGGQEGAVSAALVTGKRGLIGEETNDALRAAGLYHIVSISGLHMALAAGTVFWSVRALLALLPSVALLWPVKKIAALTAMLGAIGYCLFSGSDVATQRALIMALTMLGAVLVDRPALSMRNLAFAAILCMALEPEAVLGPSFQMSFSAVACLVALAEWQARRPPRERAARGAFSAATEKVLRTGAALVLTTLVASMATSAFGAYHFQTLMPLSLVGNALALPFVSFIVMPAGVLGVLLNPFGLDAPVWWLMGQGTVVVLAVARAMQALDLSVVVVPSFTAAGLLLFALALIVFTVCVSGLRWLAILPGGLAAILMLSAGRPDVFIDRGGASAAVRGPDGRLVILGRTSSFVVEQWLRADGDPRRPGDASLAHGVACDRYGCIAQSAGGRKVALVRHPAAFVEDCTRADIVITAQTAPPTCAAPHVVDRARLADNGAMTMTFGTAAGDVRVLGQLPADERRPWMQPLRRRATQAASPPSSDDALAASAEEPAAEDADQ